MTVEDEDEQAAEQQHIVIDACADRTEQAGKGMFAVLEVMTHVADVIEVQHTYAGQADSCAATEDLHAHRLRLEVIGTHRAEQTEEEEHTQVTQTDIAVTVFAKGVGDSTDDGQQTQTIENEAL